MKTWQKFLLGSAAAVAMAGAANAQATVQVAADGTGVNSATAPLDSVAADTNLGDPGLTPQADPTIVNLAAGTPFLQTDAILVLHVTDDTPDAFGLGASNGNVVLTLTGTGFALNGTPVLGSDAGGACQTAISGPVTADSGSSGDTVARWENITNAAIAACDDAGEIGGAGVLTIAAPVILTDTTAGISVNAQVAIEEAVTDSVVDSDTLDSPLVATVAPFATSFVADTSAPILALGDDTTPAFTTVDDGTLGQLVLDQTGGSVKTRIDNVNGTNNDVDDPVSVDVTVTLADGTGVANVTLQGGTLPATQLTAAEATPNVFTTSLDATAIGQLIASSDATVTPQTGPTLTFVPATGDDAAAIAAQAVTAEVASADGADETIASASATGDLANITRAGATYTYSWIDFAGGGAQSVLRITGLDENVNVLATVTDLQDGQTVTGDVLINDALTNAGGDEYIITGAQLGAFLADAGELTLPEAGALRGNLSLTIEQNNEQVDADRLLFQPTGGLSDLGAENEQTGAP
ncbi:hypothetical protein CCR80_08170 [Rhodothalassium salexigens]|nr:hypothetical protein [Rhodothalassium salexigens]